MWRLAGGCGVTWPGHQMVCVLAPLPCMLPCLNAVCISGSLSFGKEPWQRPTHHRHTHSHTHILPSKRLCTMMLQVAGALFTSNTTLYKTQTTTSIPLSPRLPPSPPPSPPGLLSTDCSFLRHILDSTPSMTWKIQLDNTAVTEVMWCESGPAAGWHLGRVNDVTHLALAGLLPLHAAGPEQLVAVQEAEGEL